jgi:hypothetical protein
MTICTSLAVAVILVGLIIVTAYVYQETHR